jgi:hypothetical protein
MDCSELTPGWLSPSALGLLSDFSLSGADSEAPASSLRNSISLT